MYQAKLITGLLACRPPYSRAPCIQLVYTDLSQRSGTCTRQRL